MTSGTMGDMRTNGCSTISASRIRLRRDGEGYLGRKRKKIGLRRETKKVFDVHACFNLKFDRLEGSCSLVQQRIPATIGSRDVDACAIRYLAVVFFCTG
jgi:hypothetical protein